MAQRHARCPGISHSALTNHFVAGLTFTPDLYKCGVDIVGPSNVKTLLDSIPDYWAPLRNAMLLKIGDVDADEEFNRKISPLFHVDKITAPLLIGQAANDPRGRFK